MSCVVRLFIRHSLLAGGFGLSLAWGQGIITTVAGTDPFTFGSRPALDQPIGEVWGLTTGPNGEIYFCDRSDALIYRVSPDGKLSIVAGNGVRGFSGDGGPALDASLYFPGGLALDQDGNLFISDTTNFRIRRVSPDGTIATVAGNGNRDSTGDGGPAIQASLVSPWGLAVDQAGSVYVADCDAGRVRRFGRDGIISTYAGGGASLETGVQATTAALNCPISVAFDPAGNLLVGEQRGRRVLRVAPSGIISTVFSSPDPPTLFAGWFGVAVDPTGAALVTLGSRVVQIGPDGAVTPVAGTGQAGFGGDNGSASSALLQGPTSVAVASGYVYIADAGNGRIRRVDGRGIISTFAGNGYERFFGDQSGPATSAVLSQPTRVAADRRGNVFVLDSRNQRVRRISSDGVISTVAGGGSSAADNIPATSAAVDLNATIAVDAAGVLYIADGAHIRRVSAAGLISTVYTAPRFHQIVDFAVDAAGNIYYADLNSENAPTSSGSIRRVSPSGDVTVIGPNLLAFVLTLDNAGNLILALAGAQIVRLSLAGTLTVVGDGFAVRGLAVDSGGAIYWTGASFPVVQKLPSGGGRAMTIAGTEDASGFSGDGGLAIKARLNQPWGITVDADGNVFVADRGNDRVRKILAEPAIFKADFTAISLTAKAGGLSASQTMHLSGNLAGLPVYSGVSTDKGGDWLQASPSSVTIPAAVQIIANPATLASGTYTGSISLEAPGAKPSVISIPVTFRVDAADASKLAVGMDTLSFSFTTRSSSATAQLSVLNTGSGTLLFTASASTSSGPGWLSVSPVSGTATAAAGASVAVTANPATLGAGTYTGRVSIASSTTGQRIDIPVTMIISSAQQTILLSQTGLTFTAVAAGGAVPPQTFGVLNIGQGTMTWSATASTLPAGSGWLSVTHASGSSDANSLSVPLVEVDINPAGLAEGTYYGQIQVAATADNSPQLVSVVLNVLPAGSNPGPVVRPTGLIFTAVANGANPSSQSVQISNLTGAPINFTSNVLTDDLQDWVLSSPSAATVPPEAPGRIVLQPDIRGLSPAIRQGVLTLLANGDIRHVKLLLVIAPAGSSAAALRAPASREPESVCIAKKLLPVLTSLGDGFTLPASAPTTVEARVVDDCGRPMITGSVRTTFSNGDSAVTLVSLKDGRWSGTWAPRQNASQVTVTVLAANPDLNIEGSTQVVGGLQAGSTVPVIDPDGVVSTASLGPAHAPLAPGSLVSISGTGLSVGGGQSNGLPLGTELAGTAVTVATRPVPLFSVSDKLITGILPYDIPVNTRLQLLVKRQTSLAVPEFITVAAAQPAIFTKDDTGKGQGRILDSQWRYVEPGNPATAGDPIVIYCAGLGAVDPRVDAGAGAPDAPQSNVVNPVELTIGDLPATVTFKGLLANSTGVYQVNATVPAGVPPGDAVPVVLTVAGQSSIPVTMAVR
jgi:uncharacterized protein (TIGR03437 family)